MTLRFLGEVDESAVAPLGEALVSSCAGVPGPVECRLGPGDRVVHRRTRPATAREQASTALAEAVRVATVPLVPEAPGGAPFNGHLTLARSKGRRLSVAALGEMSGIPFEAAFRVPYVDLVSSEPSAHGHVYTTVVRAPIGSGWNGDAAAGAGSA